MRIPTLYKIENKITKDCYIGSTTNYSRRCKEHLYTLKNNTHHSIKLQEAWDTYGEANFNFKILKEYVKTTSNKILKDREQVLLDKEKPKYNISLKASGWCNKLVPVVQLTPTDKIVKHYRSIMEANIALGLDPYDVGITTTLSGRQNSSRGFKWIDNRTFKSDFQIVEESKNITTGMSPIQQLDIVTGEIINEGFVGTFKALGFDGSAVSKVLRGEYISHKGFIFRRYDPFPKRNLILGIDSGKKGGLVLLNMDTNKLFMTPMFLTEDNEYDLHRISKYIKDHSTSIAISGLEEVHSIFQTSKNTAFLMGYGLGFLKGMLVAHEIETVYPNPKTWQKDAWEGVTKQKDNKQTSLLAVRRLFPDYSFLATTRSRVPHDGLVDAALIAYYCKLKFSK